MCLSLSEGGGNNRYSSRRRRDRRTRGGDRDDIRYICERLACLYTVRDHLKAKQNDESKSSEFLTAAVGIPTPELMAVIDQHMEAIKVVYPSEYNAIVAKIRSLHEAT